MQCYRIVYSTIHILSSSIEIFLKTRAEIFLNSILVGNFTVQRSTSEGNSLGSYSSASYFVGINSFSFRSRSILVFSACYNIYLYICVRIYIDIRIITYLNSIMMNTMKSSQILSHICFV